MRALFITLVVVLVVIAGLAYWLNWWHISAAPSSEKGKSGVQLTTDKDKMNQDVKDAEGKIKEELHKVKGGSP